MAAHTGYTEEQAKAIAELAGEAAAKKVLLSIGIDASTPEAAIQRQDDFAYLRRARQGQEAVARYAKRTAIGAFTGGVLYVLWESVKAGLRAKVGGG